VILWFDQFDVQGQGRESAPIRCADIGIGGDPKHTRWAALTPARAGARTGSLIRSLLAVGLFNGMFAGCRVISESPLRILLGGWVSVLFC